MQCHYYNLHLIFSPKMQQPATVNGVQVIVVAQTAPLNTQTRYRNMTNEIAKKFNILGKAHIVMGALCIVFQIVSLGFSSYSEGPGIWIGSLVRPSPCIAYLKCN